MSIRFQKSDDGLVNWAVNSEGIKLGSYWRDRLVKSGFLAKIYDSGLWDAFESEAEAKQWLIEQINATQATADSAPQA